MTATAAQGSTTPTWDAYRGRLQTYFDKTAVDAWAALTSDAPVSRIRATVRAGRDAMRDVLLGWLPGDMTGLTLLDAGCGTGALAVAAARRGARVTAIDISGSLVSLAQARAPARFDDDGFSGGSIDWRVGDMTGLGVFDHVVAMDSLIHYPAADIVATVAALASRTRRSLAFTFAPASPLLSAMHTAGKLFPRGDRAPAIQPVAEAVLRRDLAGLDGAAVRRGERVSGGFYTSHALEVVRA